MNEVHDAHKIRQKITKPIFHSKKCPIFQLFTIDWKKIADAKIKISLKLDFSFDLI